MNFLRGRPSPVIALLMAILAAALALRLIGFRFGLPSLYDPDEPFFIITGLKLLKDHTLNPAWFGHPGTTTIYALALIEICVIGIGLLTGRFADIHAFGEALYADPSVIFVPARLFIILCGVVCVLLTFLIGRRLFDDRVGLTAATLLAVNPLHIQYSQIIRTDVHATVFMLLCVLSCIAIVRTGRLKHYLFAAIFLGLSCATKWPAATAVIAIPAACWLRCLRDSADAGRQIRYLLMSLVTSVAALLVTSPYLLLDYRQVVHDLGGEAQPAHLGATGGNLASNLVWYVTHPIGGSIGIVGVAFAVIGIVVSVRRSPSSLATIIPVFAVFLLAIASQHLIWGRWCVPLLPFATLFSAVGIWALADWMRMTLGHRVGSSVVVVALVAAITPMAIADAAQARERENDTRAIASAWAKTHIPSGSTVLVEYLALDLLPEHWQFIFPAALLGCIDGNKALRGQIRSTTVGDWRGGRQIIDIGTIDPSQLDMCRADYAIYTDYDRYMAEPAAFPGEAKVYQDLAQGGTPVLTVRPVAGRIGGPVVRIIRLGPDHRPSASAPPVRIAEPIGPHVG